MARVRAIYEHEKERHGKQKDTDAYVAVYEKDGARFLQIDSHGSDDRQDKGTVSQNLLFDVDMLAMLIAIIRREFPDLLR